MRLDVCLFTSRGGRDHNEDCGSYRVEGDRGVFLVADGLGGHGRGEEASACVVDVFTAAWSRETETVQGDWLEKQFARANEAVLQLQREKHGMMKTTAVALVIGGGAARWGHAGDSRLYCLRDGGIYAFTADHSVAYRKYCAGEIAKQDIATDEDQSMLLRNLGSKDRFAPELSPVVQIGIGDAFLLCTDGAWEYLLDGEILLDYLKAREAREWAERLLLRALSRVPYGKNDNLTLMAVMAGE